MSIWDSYERSDPLEDLEKDPNAPKRYKPRRPRPWDPEGWSESRQRDAEINKAFFEGFWSGVVSLIIVGLLFFMANLSPKYNPKARPTRTSAPAQPSSTISPNIDKLWSSPHQPRQRRLPR